MTGKAFTYSTTLTYKGLRGLTTAYDPIAGEWTMYAIAANSGNFKLVKIDPATGVDTLSCQGARRPQSQRSASHVIVPQTTNTVPMVILRPHWSRHRRGFLSM